MRFTWLSVAGHVLAKPLKGLGAGVLEVVRSSRQHVCSVYTVDR